METGHISLEEQGRIILPTWRLQLSVRIDSIARDNMLIGLTVVGKDQEVVSAERRSR